MANSKKKVAKKKVAKPAIKVDPKQQVMRELSSPSLKKDLLKQRNLQSKVLVSSSQKKDFVATKWFKTGIEGFDQLFDKGIPKGSSVVVCGGPGSGKTLFCLQALYNAALRGEKCLYFTIEERVDKLIGHMKDFGWDYNKVKNNLIFKRIEPFEMGRQIEAMLEKASGELMIDLAPVIFPADMKKPDVVALDSLAAVASVFSGDAGTYRIYVEQLFRLLENLKCTSFLIAETIDFAKSTAGPSDVENFLADGVILLYNIRQGNIRESAIEVLKMRGASFKKRVSALEISSEGGIIVYPDQEVFSISSE